MQFYFDFLGCRLNEAEIANWRRALEGRGELVNDPETADVITLNTCAVTSEAARKSRRALRQLANKNPRAHLVATGCYATLEPQKTADLLGVDMVLSNKDKDQFVSKVAKALSWGSQPKSSMSPHAQPAFAQNRTRAFVKVQDGCRNKCSYCIVTIARGQERSRSIEDVCTEINHLTELGYQEAILTGVHLGGYGADLGVDLTSLVATILDRTTIPRLRIGSLEPWDLPPDFFTLWTDKRLCPHLHLPLQSGCDSVLKRMIRRCTVAEYEALLNRAREQNPDFHVSSDIIVGFPGETEKEFEQTLETVEKMAFGDLHLFRYSPRQGTAAARMKNHVNKATAAARHAILKELGTRLKQERLSKIIGQSRSILWERETERNHDNQLIWSGYTEDYHRTTISSERPLFNQITDAKVIGMDSNGRLEVELEGTHIAN